MNKLNVKAKVKHSTDTIEVKHSYIYKSLKHISCSSFKTFHHMHPSVSPHSQHGLKIRSHFIFHQSDFSIKHNYWNDSFGWSKSRAKDRKNAWKKKPSLHSVYPPPHCTGGAVRLASALGKGEIPSSRVNNVWLRQTLLHSPERCRNTRLFHLF